MRIAMTLAASVAVGATSAMAAILPTTHYSANDNVLPNAAGQIFAGGVASGTAFMSLVDIGDGALALEFNTQDGNANAGAFFQKTAAQSPVTWAVDAATGYSVEFRLRFDSDAATETGAADLIIGNASRAVSLRLLKGAGAPNAIATIVSATNSNAVLGTTPVLNAAQFHTYRVDVLGDSVQFFVNGQLLIDAVDATESNAFNFIRFGDATGANDGKYQLLYLDTYQGGVVPEPASLAAVLPVAAAMLARRRSR